MIVDFLGFSFSLLWAIFILILWIIVAFWPASIAKQKGYSFLGWFVMSLFFWWISLFVALFFLQDKTKSSSAKDE